jgi:hypothetical protein
VIGNRPGWIFPDDDEHDSRLRDFRAWLYAGFTAMGLGEPTKRQYEIAIFLQHAPKKALVMGYRGVGKSAITNFLLVWLLYWWPQKRIVTASAAETRALANGQYVRRILEEFEPVRHLKPRKGIERDNALAFDVAGAIPMADTSVRVVGIMGQATGFHADAVCGDDVEIPNNSETPGARMKLAARQAELGGALLNPNGFIRNLGTPQTEDSIYNGFEEKGYTVRRWPARFPDPNGLGPYRGQLAKAIREELAADPLLAGTPTDPERYDEETLRAAEIEYRRQGFALQFQLDTSLSDADLYPLRLRDLIVMDLDPRAAPEQVMWSSDELLAIADIQCLGRDGDYYVKPLTVLGEFRPYEGGILAVDPSGRGRDELAWVAVKILNGQLFLLGLGAEIDGFEALPRIAIAASRYGVNAIVTEANFGGGSYNKLLKDALRDVYPCQVIEVNHNVKKEQRILRTLEPVMANHKLVTSPAVLREDIRLAQQYGGDGWIYRSLAHQLSRITGAPGCLHFDDRIDALAIAVAYYSERVEGNTARFLERRKQEKADADMRRWLGDTGLRAGQLEPNSLGTNRGIGFMRRGGRTGMLPERPRFG